MLDGVVRPSACATCGSPGSAGIGSRRLHELILRIADNHAIGQAFARTHCHLHFFRLSYNQPFGEQTITEHRAIVSALAAGKPSAAHDAMTHHLETARDRLLSRFWVQAALTSARTCSSFR